MKIVLVGGGSGGHITPLIAVARELKRQDADIQIIGVCEAGSAFMGLYKDAAVIDEVYQIPAGKFRRYGGRPFIERITDFETLWLNIRDVFRTLRGYRQARKLLRRLKPDAMLIKGGFVAVPMGLAASRLKIPFMTHDSDSTPGLANRIVGRWAALHATGMPAELYNYPKDKTVYTGIPISQEFVPVTEQLRAGYRKELGLEDCDKVITIVGGSQGGGQLNEDVLAIAPQLMSAQDRLGIVHIAGKAHLAHVKTVYEQVLTPDQYARVRVSGFVTDVAVRQGAADVVVSRASATVTAELAVQRLPVVFVPGRLAGSHQEKNAQYFADNQAALVAPFGDKVELQQTVESLLSQPQLAEELKQGISRFARPTAAAELALAVSGLAGKE